MRSDQVERIAADLCALTARMPRDRDMDLPSDNRQSGRVRRLTMLVPSLGGSGTLTMLQFQVAALDEIRTVRASIRDEPFARNVVETDIEVLNAVISELIGAAFDSRVQPPIVVTVETFARLHSIRVRVADSVELVDEPFRLRERILQALTLAFGQRRNGDGTVDLWAEVVRTS
jgi:hypothetical protein